MKLALVQFNATVGDIGGNCQRITARLSAAANEGADLIVFGELAVTGYPPEDLLLKRDFTDAARAGLEKVASGIGSETVLVGFPEVLDGRLYNAAAVLRDGKIIDTYRKWHLPNYGVFDERRYFEPGEQPYVIDIGGMTVGITICEDLWVEGEPAISETTAGAELIVNLSASPYHAGKGSERAEMFSERARTHDCAIAFCNLVGGQDELVFDGDSLLLDREGECVARAAQFEQQTLYAEITDEPHGTVTTRLEAEAEIYAALKLGLTDYVHKNGFGHVVLGLSGGIDSSLVACIAADALGAECVTTAVMPSPYSSKETQGDARELSRRLGVQCMEFQITEAMSSYEDLLAETFKGRESDVTEENLQARIRGNILMALSNKFGWLVLTTGNKSETSVGYSTLYGDAAGGFAVIKDCPKTLVYRLAHYRNGLDPVIPETVLTRAPSAELRPGQRDVDSLPPYELLDQILAGYVEERLGLEELAAGGLPEEDVRRVIELVDRAEYKRRQSPPGIKITPLAFGRDRRMPITNRYGR